MERKPSEDWKNMSKKIILDMFAFANMVGKSST